jgi:hypothetical protein
VAGFARAVLLVALAAGTAVAAAQEAAPPTLTPLPPQVRPDGTAVDLPTVRARPGGYRFLPDGKGLVYLPFIPSLDFWLVDFAAKTPRQLTHLSNRGSLGTFDITADGKAIVFDRSRENSDIVLIDLPK